MKRGFLLSSNHKKQKASSSGDNDGNAGKKMHGHVVPPPEDVIQTSRNVQTKFQSLLGLAHSNDESYRELPTMTTTTPTSWKNSQTKSLSSSSFSSSWGDTNANQQRGSSWDAPPPLPYARDIPRSISTPHCHNQQLGPTSVTVSTVINLPTDADDEEEEKEMENENNNYTSKIPENQTQASIAVNPYKHMSFLPSMFGEPKLGLIAVYGQEKEFSKGIQVTNQCYFTWEQKDCQAHNRKFTSIFVCPVAYERFRSGRYYSISTKNHSQKFVVDNNNATGIVWLNSKKEAEHAAAARRLDCYIYRKTLSSMMKTLSSEEDTGSCSHKTNRTNCHDESTSVVKPTTYWGLDLPYQKGEGPSTTCCPLDIEERIKIQITKWKKEAMIRLEKERATSEALAFAERERMEIEEETKIDRLSYIEQRRRQQ